jgi:hypothetical protein
VVVVVVWLLSSSSPCLAICYSAANELGHSAIVASFASQAVVAGAGNHPNCLVLPFTEATRRAAAGEEHALFQRSLGSVPIC